MLCTLSLPLLAQRFGFAAVFLSRFLMGLGEVSARPSTAEPPQGLILPSINKLIGNWIPLEELSTAASIYTTGNQMAGGIGAPLTAALCGTRFRWPAIFYTGGEPSDP